MPDYSMPRFHGWFDDWVETMYTKSEAVIIDEEFANNWITARTYAYMRNIGKPIYFVSPEAHQAWESRANSPSQPTK